MAYLGGATKSQTIASPGGATVTIPATSTIPNGSAMLALFSYAANDAPVFDDPAGWAFLGTLTHTTVLTTRVYSKIRAAGDTAVGVVVEAGSTGKSTMMVLGYSGMDATTPFTIHNADETTNRTIHPMPTVAGVAAGSTLIEWIVDRGGPGSTALTPPGTQTLRLENYQLGGGALSGAVGDAAPVSGTVGTSDSWTGTISTNNANMWSIIGNPAAATTVVGKNFTAVYNIRAVVNKSITYKYNIGAAVTLQFVSAVSKIGATSTSVTFNGPTGMSVNQIQFLFIDWADNGAMTADPTGNTDGSTWTPITPTTGSNPSVDGVNLSTRAFVRIMRAGDNGKAYTATIANTAKYSVSIVVYQQVDVAAIFDFAAFTTEPGTTASHVMPTGTVSTAGCWLLEHVADRGGPGSTLFTAPGSFVKRTEQYDTGGGAVSHATGDSNNTVATGTRGGETWTGTLSTATATMIAIAVKPATAPVSAVGKNFTAVYGISKVVQKLFTVKYNILTIIITILRFLIDDDMGLTDAGQSQIFIDTINEDMSLTDDTTNNLVHVAKNFTVVYNVLQTLGVEIDFIYAINPANIVVGKNFTVLYAIKQSTELLWIEEDSPATTIWKELT